MASDSNLSKLLEAKEKITQGLVGLTLRLPFMASAVMRFRTLPADPARCPTAMTDGTVTWYSPDFVLGLTNPEVRGVLCHEVLHILFEHADRERGRNHGIWNLACDYAVNDILKSFGISLPSGALWSQELSGMSAEAVYDRLIKHKGSSCPRSRSAFGDSFAGAMPAALTADDLIDRSEADARGLSRRAPTLTPPSDDGGQQSPRDQSGSTSSEEAGNRKSTPEDGASDRSDSQSAPRDGSSENGDSGKDRPKNGSESPAGGADKPAASSSPSHSKGSADEDDIDLDSLRELIGVLRKEIMSAARDAGRGSPSMEEEIAASAKLGLAWREILQQWMIDRVKTDWSTWPPSKKHLWQGLYLPSVGVPAPGRVIFAIDTSGSMCSEWLARIWSEVAAFRETFPTPISIIDADDRIQRVRTLEDFEPMPDSKTCRLQGRGGTSFVPVFKWIEEQNFTEPVMLIYATDGWGEFPSSRLRRCRRNFASDEVKGLPMRHRFARSRANEALLQPFERSPG